MALWSKIWVRKRLQDPKLAAVAYVGLAAVDSVLAGRGTKPARAARMVTKPLLMPTLAHAFFHATGAQRIEGKAILAGQAASFAGDIALLGESPRHLKAGIGSFFAGQLCYAAAFAQGAERGNPFSSRGVQVGTGLFAVAGPASAYAAGRVDPGLRWPVLAYAGAISTMFAASASLSPELSRRARLSVLGGSGLFVASDLMLAAQRFVLKGPASGLDAAVMATYAAGQGLIASGMAAVIDQRQAAERIGA